MTEKAPTIGRSGSSPETGLSTGVWRKITELLDGLAELGPEARQAKIEAAEAADPELGRYVETFLRDAELLRETRRRSPLDDLPSLRDLEDVDLAGAELGAYRLGRRIGRGGMGEVYLAERVDGELERQVAIKVSRAGLDPRAEALFSVERDILARLTHPGIARLYDAGHENGLAYLVMEYIDGVPIDAHCRDKNLDFEARLRLLIDVCRAVHYAHQNLVLHRDLKPGNILVLPTGEPKLLDFGISGWLRKDASGEIDAVSTENVDAFTPGFASPEQENPSRGAVGMTSDVFSLGRVLEYLVPPLIMASDRRSEDLVYVLKRALAPDPAARYPSAEQLAEDLERLLAHRPVVARPRSRLHTTRLFCRRNRGWVLAASLLMALLVGVGAVAVYQADVAQQAAAQAEQEKRAVLRLSDIRRLTELEAQAENLWPMHPRQVAAMDAWLASADALRARLDGHRSTLAEIEARLELGVVATDDVKALWWQRDILRRLTDGLDAWGGESGLVSEIETRRELATTLEARSVGAYDGAWREALAGLKARPHYGGLSLAPQIGLVPLGFDPQSDLLEVAVLDTGEIPARDVAGALQIEQDMAVVLVLLPAGPAVLGAQDEDPSAPNYDPDAMRGADDPMPPISADFEPFFLSKFELTQNQWARLTAGSWPSQQNAKFSKNPINGEPLPLHLPVEQVNWSDADRWLRRHNLRLPSEAEWEYGARAGTDTPWWSGRAATSLADAGNVADQYLKSWGGNPEWPYTLELDDGHSVPAPIGTYRANAFGLHEIHGNVGEWCAGAVDVDSRYGSTPELRIVRGGSWWYTAQYAKITYRLKGAESNALADVGMRPARSLDD